MEPNDKERIMKQPRKFSFQDMLNNSVLGRLDLRGKLTLGNMLIALLVVLVMGAYLYLRIQDASRQLIVSVDQNARSRAEEDLQSTTREQAAFLDSFFENMNRNTSIATTSIKDILDDDKLVDSTYWDAEASLTRLSTGSWDNDNSEISSIFIPAEVNLNGALTRKLNLLKHSELIFPSVLQNNPDIVAIYFGGTFKETIYYPNIDLAGIVPPDFDVTGRQWYVAAEPENNPQQGVVWSAPYQDAALNGLVITTSAPVIDRHGRFQGVAAMDVQLTRIIDVVANVKAGDTGYAFLIDNNGRLISLPDVGFNDFNITDENAKLSDIVDPSTLSTLAPEFNEVMNKIAQDTQGLFTTTLAGTERHIAFYEIPQVQYKLVLIVPSEELFSGRTIISEQISRETNTTINLSVLLIAMIFVVAAAASFGFSNRLTQPLKSLNRTAEEIIRGNFNAKARVNSRDELETLATTLNTMTDTVGDLISSLEKRVSERTSDLQKEIEHGERRRKQYEAIAKVAQAITTQKNLKELLPQITDVISEQFGFYHVGIFLNDALNKYAVLAAANSAGGQNMLKRGHQLKVGAQGIVGYVTGNKQPRIALSVGEDAVYFNNPDLPETQSEMALPLIEAGNVLGALDVQSRDPSAFSDEDLEALTILAELVSIAIQNAKLYEQMDRSLAEAEAASRQYFRENWNRLTEDTNIAGYRYTAGGAAPLTTTEAVDDKQKIENTDRKNISVPIIMRGQEIGELSVTVPKDETVKSDQMDLIRAVADRVAVIAENARLFDETTKRAERERLVSDISTKIRGTNDPQTMIETAIKELREALKVSRIEIVPQKQKLPDR
ncbi:MAG: GAF domain-containing protein [Anaerolineales bacterium]|nr:GAF domain-containing protein [Anaerolineales bacterium]